jgi:hypothetical protein
MEWCLAMTAPAEAAARSGDSLGPRPGNPAIAAGKIQSSWKKIIEFFHDQLGLLVRTMI